MEYVTLSKYRGWASSGVAEDFAYAARRLAIPRTFRFQRPSNPAGSRYLTMDRPSDGKVAKGSESPWGHQFQCTCQAILQGVPERPEATQTAGSRTKLYENVSRH
jgi:hypothetical protein